jgi:hypothetical protein
MPSESTTYLPPSNVTISKGTAYVVQVEVLTGTGWDACAPPVQAPDDALAFRLRIEESPAASDDGKAACGRCERCATAEDRPPVDVDLDQWLARRDASYRNALLETIAVELVTIRGVLERQEG